jgi:hypothetical protein
MYIIIFFSLLHRESCFNHLFNISNSYTHTLYTLYKALKLTLTLILLMWRIRWSPNNASICQWDLTWHLTFWHRSFTFNSNKSPTWSNNFSVYYPEVCLYLNMFRAFSHPSSGAQWLQWQPLVLPSYRGDRRAVFVVGPVGRLRFVSPCIIVQFK